MSDWLWIAGGIAIGAIGLALAVVLLGIFRLISELTKTVKLSTEQVVPMLGSLNETVAGINVELARVDTIMAGVQSITATADSLVGVVHNTVSNPLIKVAAYATGVARGARKLKG